jgi:hypothetical protein
MFGRKRKAQDLADEVSVQEWLDAVGQEIEEREARGARRATAVIDEQAGGLTRS